MHAKKISELCDNLLEKMEKLAGEGDAGSSASYVAAIVVSQTFMMKAFAEVIDRLDLICDALENITGLPLESGD